MSRPRWGVRTARRDALTLLVAVAAVVTVVLAGPRPPAAVANPNQLFVYRVAAASDEAVQRLFDRGFDVLEDRSGADVLVLGNAATAHRLRAAGFAAAVVEKVETGGWQPPSTRLVPDAKPLAVAPIDETYDGGYHTVRAQYAHLDKVAADHPTLATVVDYGDSFLKQRNPATGYDLKANCLTRKRAGDCALTPQAPKARFLLMTQIHAREIVTGDIAWRFIDHLAVNYGSNTQVTNLLNTIEVWVVPIVNPDGVDLVQQGGTRPLLQRKNLDDVNGTSCPRRPSGSGQTGVDLNRNNANHWGGASTSRNPCSEVYPGPAGNSEPETRAIQRLFRQLFADQRGPADTDAAPVTTRGAMISMHSFAGMNLFPWAFNSGRHAPNDAALRRIAAHMSQLNGYRFGQPGEILYNASGTSDDWSYGELGIASFTIEARSCGSFTPAYSCTTTDFAKNLPVLMYVAGLAPAPYRA